MRRKLTTKEVVERFKKVHGDEYDYSLVEYENQEKKIIIVCRVHGDFPQTPVSHWSGKGCPKCGIIKQSISIRKTTEKFIEEAKLVHGDKYDYHKVDYKNGRIEVIIVCPVHGEFLQVPNNHVAGNGCYDCSLIVRAEKRKLGIEKFIERSNHIHNNFYQYENVEYIDAITIVKITCPVHGDFPQVPDSHLSGRGCPKCGDIKAGDKQRKTVEQFLEEANLKHNGIYKYDNVDYKGGDRIISITCTIHGDFPQTPASHLNGKGCPKCFNKSEGRLAIILNEIGVVHRGYRINNRFFDFYLPEYNLIIERDGEQHYFNTFRFRGKRKKSIEEHHQIDIEKTNLAKSKGHKICRIPYWLSEEDERKEIQNILNGQPTYPDVPDLEQAKTKPLPN